MTAGGLIVSSVRCAGPRPRAALEAILDRRRFLIAAGRAGLAGLGAAALAGCSPQVVVHVPGPSPQGTSQESPQLPNPSPTPTATVAAGTPPPRFNPIVAENARRGTQGWIELGHGPATVSGFFSAASAAAGEKLALHADATVPFDISWYRLGWYGGEGARLVRVDRGLPARRAGTRPPDPEPDPITGLVEATWPVVLTIEVPSTWLSGMYAAVLEPVSGQDGIAPFVVRPSATFGQPASAVAPVLFVSAATTWQAYNTWGGADFYGASAEDAPEAAAGRRAVAVSFDRPYVIGAGGGYQRRWELQFVRWQEREGRDVAYAADVDLELHPELLAGRRLVVFAGHHEYWSRPMRTAVEGAVGRGTNVAFLSGNEVYWQVRFEPSPLGPARRVVCYKSALLDPITASRPDLATARWREPPVNDPEATLIGQMYGHIVRRPGDWIVRQHDHWLYEGTGLDNGDRIVNLVGQEYDTFFPEYAHPGTVLLAQGPVEAIIRPSDLLPSPSIHTATMYTADSGATVFSAGTFQWSWALDDFGDRTYNGLQTPVDRRVGLMTRNLFDRLGDGPAS